MKKLVFFLWLIFLSLVSNLSFAQITLKKKYILDDSLSYRENFDYFVANLDKLDFPTNILYDRVVHLAQLDNFNPDNPKNTSDYKHFIQAYYELYLASFNNKRMKTFQEMKQQVKKIEEHAAIPIGVLNFSYNYLDSMALKDGSLIVKNNQLYKNENAKIEYVKEKEAFVAAILSNELATGEHDFIFNNDFIFSSNKSKIETLELNFGTETGSFKLKPGEKVKITLNKTGERTVNYTLYLKNGEKLSGYSTIKIVAQDAQKGIIPISNCGHQRVESGYYLDYEGVNKRGIADMYFYYSNCNNPVLKKPIIIFDGFDPDDTRDEAGIYEIINETHYLANDLRTNGFDVVIVNFPTGADYIVRNAYAAIEAIKWVNQHKTTNNKLVVVGPSMGGLISRYALAKMEKDGLDHETGLWISFDAPHQGANIAIGDQYFLDFFARQANDAGAIGGLAKINSPAAKQMLLDHYSKPWNHEKPLCSSYRNIFINELTNNGLAGSNGYPQNLHKLALLNGSGLGTKQEGIDNYTYLLEMRKKILGLTVALGQVKTSADLSYTRRWVLYAYLASPSYWTQRWSQPDDSPYFTTSYDKAPGGYNPTQSILAEGNSDFTVYYPNHSFISSVSALDLQDPYLTLNIANANIIQTNRTPFDDYYAPVENQKHISFTALSTNWVKNQIGINSSISGADIVCSNNKTFTLVNRPAGSTIYWTKSSNLYYGGGQGTNSYTVRSNGSGNGWVKADVSINGYVNSYAKTFIVGNPTTPIIYCYHSTVGLNSQIEAFASSSGEDNYTWSISGGTLESGQGTSEVLIRTSSHCLYDLTIRVTASNSCGNSIQAVKSIPFDCSGAPSPLKVSPNPARETLTVEIREGTIKPDVKVTNEVYTVRILNSYQVSMYDNEIREKRFNINISSFPIGIYYLQVTRGKEMYSKIVIISD